MLPEQVEQLIEREVVRWTVLLRFDCSPVLRLQTGPFTVETREDDPYEPGEAYLGLGWVTELPEFAQLINGQAQRLDIKLAGTDPVLRAALLDPTNGVRDKAVKIGLLFYDERYQVADRAVWFGRFTCDVITDGRSNKVDTITLSIVSGDPLKLRAMIVYWTDANHRRKHPTDSIMRRVAGYGPQTSRKWG